MELAQLMENQYSNNRKLVRYQIDYDSIRIFDLNLASSLGQVENITLDGFLLRSAQGTPLDREFRISLSMPGHITERFIINCSARSLWSSPVTDLQGREKQARQEFWTGYKFLDLSEDGIETIEAMIAIFGNALN